MISGLILSANVLVYFFAGVFFLGYAVSEIRSKDGNGDSHTIVMSLLLFVGFQVFSVFWVLIAIKHLA